MEPVHVLPSSACILLTEYGLPFVATVYLKTQGISASDHPVRNELVSARARAASPSSRRCYRVASRHIVCACSAPATGAVLSLPRLFVGSLHTHMASVKPIHIHLELPIPSSCALTCRSA